MLVFLISVQIDFFFSCGHFDSNVSSSNEESFENMYFQLKKKWSPQYKSAQVLHHKHYFFGTACVTRIK